MNLEYMCGAVVVSNICIHLHTWVCRHRHHTGARRRQIRLEQIRVSLTRISSQLPVSDLGEWRHICHRDKKCDASHLSHFWEECDALAHENPFFILWRFFVTFFPKNVTFWPRLYKLEEMWRFGWELKNSYLFPSQICHLSRKHEAGEPFRLTPRV